MSISSQAPPVVDEILENPKILRAAGSILFFLGFAAAFLAYTQDVSAGKVNMVLNAAILLALGYPMLLYIRALQKIALLEKRIKELEHSHQGKL
jgi:hypothetical protein